MSRAPSVGLIALAFIAFISLGLPDGLLGVAWPFMRSDFAQPLDALGLLLVSFTSGYLLSSFFSGAIVRAIGIGLLLTASVTATALALLGFTVIPVWWMIVPLCSLLGAGAGAIDAGLNNYVAANHSDRVMQWLHASFGVGVTLGPMIMTMGLTLGDSWRIGYWVVGGGQLALALCFLLTARFWDTGVPEAAAEAPAPTPDASFKATFGQHRAWLCMLLFFIYSGLELSVGLWAFSLLTESRGISIERAGFWVSIYWAMFTVGRITAGLYARRLGVDSMVYIGLTLALLAAILLWWSPVPAVGLGALALAGFAYAPIFPAMVSGTRLRIERTHVTNTIGMQMAGAGLGAAALPALAGAIAARTSLESLGPFLFCVSLSLVLLYSFIRWSRQ
ncbi:MAG: MFS transporter [Natronospirillum sp.]|uniref:MFS transporter n=1 Tax=Natronospirillum sp. TaxID=2812955 RepID=UPI0025DCDBD1|nr:MFS transporter [Natronospirillum sp.]MCH8551513.1 MFS transporter [Natronospirillum sp.]